MVTIAVVQCEVIQYAPEINLHKMRRFIEAAAAASADIIVFPEDAITGPINGNQQFVDFDGTYLQHFCELAREYALDIVPGSIIEGDDSGWYNTTYYIDSTGIVQGKYRKIHLWHPERCYLLPGHTAPVFDTAYGRVGLLICWDLIFPEVFRAMVRQDVDIVICPSYWCFEDAGIGLKHDPDAEVHAVNALCVARAFENEIILVYANAAISKSGDDLVKDHLIGRSQITVPFKGATKILNHPHEEMFIQSVNTALLKDAESAYKIRSDLRQAAFLEQARVVHHPDSASLALSPDSAG